MKMYNAQLSPYAARCRILIYAKGLDVELAEMPDAISTEDFAKISPMHKVPTLDDDGQIVPESQTICEYLEDRGPGPSLTPDDPAHRTRMRLLARMTDLYILEPLGKLFGQINPQGRDQIVVDHEFEELAKAVRWLGFYLDGSQYAVGDKLTIADCALVPALFFIDSIGPMFGRQDLLGEVPTVKSYFQAVAADPFVGKVLGEIEEALRKMQAA